MVIEGRNDIKFWTTLNNRIPKSHFKTAFWLSHSCHLRRFIASARFSWSFLRISLRGSGDRKLRNSVQQSWCCLTTSLGISVRPWFSSPETAGSTTWGHESPGRLRQSHQPWCSLTRGYNYGYKMIELHWPWMATSRVLPGVLPEFCYSSRLILVNMATIGYSWIEKTSINFQENHPVLH